MSATKRLFLLLILSSVSITYGCATARPNFYNGKYYMAGDDNCRYMRQIATDRIMCSNANHVDIGYRDAMTDQQLQMYMNQQQVNATLLAPQLNKPQPQKTSTTCYPDPLGRSMTCY